MTRPAPLPTIAEVRTLIAELAESTGKPPAVLAVARRLGLANTTFRRNFPDIADQLRAQRGRPTPSADDAGAASRFEKLQRDNDKLRRHNQQLDEHLELACAAIQRLTLDNHRLRRELEAATNITRIGGRRR
ncbi:hypothetical protein [Mycobacterium sp. SP-6446]|uniref:hypothetical protein n=1 Tax=Mycobacterium sp. SP-6446 TaxID=1834162 RepID=UPI00096CB352|nr:hypothetical protein [Mycobacterium sp. SP-6446]OMC20553.1 hypothetical protein A5736_12290 [Mycobacterium sp. SP-6446]